MSPITLSRPLRTLLLGLSLLCGSLLYSLPASAIGAFKPTPGELALLPPYCRPRAETWGNDASRPEVARWMGVFPSDYIHMHHYCVALLAINNAQVSMNEPERRANYNRAMNNLEYMQERASPGFVLWPDLLHNRAKVERGLGDTGAAVISLQKAIERNANYTPPYAELADIHVSLGHKEEARQVLEAGLAKQPDSSLLRRKLNCLDNRNAPGCH